MVERGTGRILIVDPVSRRVVGILSRHDLLKARDTTRARGKAAGALTGIGHSPFDGKAAN